MDSTVRGGVFNEIWNSMGSDNEWFILVKEWRSQCQTEFALSDISSGIKKIVVMEHESKKSL